MQDRQTAGLDPPFEALVWEDENAQVWLTYADPDHLVDRHGLSTSSAPVITAIKEGVTKMVSGAYRRS